VRRISKKGIGGGDMDHYSETEKSPLGKLLDLMKQARIEANNLCLEVFGIGFDEWLKLNKDKVEAIDTENTTECDVCEAPCPDGELRCCEDHDLQAIGLMEEGKKYVDEDLEFERQREFNFGKEE
jgi:hypothetical protein